MRSSRKWWSLSVFSRSWVRPREHSQVLLRLKLVRNCFRVRYETNVLITRTPKKLKLNSEGTRVCQVFFSCICVFVQHHSIHQKLRFPEPVDWYDFCISQTGLQQTVQAVPSFNRWYDNFVWYRCFSQCGKTAFLILVEGSFHGFSYTFGGVKNPSLLFCPWSHLSVGYYNYKTLSYALCRILQMWEG